MRRAITFIGSFAFTGFFPLAPATFASFVFVLIYLWLPGGKVLASLPCFALLLFVSVPVASRMERDYGHDARCIVIDEIVAMQLLLVGADASSRGVWAAFFLFRFFDVVKPFPAGASQKLPGGWGVVTDDIVSALYTRIIMILLSLPFAWPGDFGL